MASSAEIRPTTRSRVRTRNPLKVWWMVEVCGYRILLRKNLPTMSLYRVRVNQYEWLLCKKSDTGVDENMENRTDHLIALQKGEDCVVVNGPGISVHAANRLAIRLDLCLRFAPYGARRTPAAKTSSRLVVNAELFSAIPNPISVVPPAGLWICNNTMRNLGTYFGIESEWFFALFATMGTIQLKSLVKNDLLRQEDLIHNRNCTCLFAHHLHFSQWLSTFEDTRICAGSASFYRCLGCENEMNSLSRLIDELRKTIS
jgi:hypothetical protein